MTWREEVRPLIRRALADTEGLPYRERRKRLREVWAASMQESRRAIRGTYRYGVWLDEVRRQLGHKKKRKGLKQQESQRRLFG